MTRFRRASALTLLATCSTVVGKPALNVFVHVGKTGSSTVRSVFKDAQVSTSKKKWLWQGFGKEEKWNKTESLSLARSRLPASTEVAIGLEFGACQDAAPGSCRYFTVLREPVSRAVSEFNYFCKDCRENNKFCKQNRKKTLSSCPNMDFLSWVARAPNQYVHHFARNWTRHDEYFYHYWHGFKEVPALTEHDFNASVKALRAPNMLLVWTDELDIYGWDRIRHWVNGTQATPAISSELQKRNKLSNAHVNKQHSYTYIPNEAERRQACEIMQHDCRLYELLRAPLSSAQGSRTITG